VVLGILTALLGLLLPAVHRVRDASHRAHCANNLRQLGVALHGYHGDYGMLPPGIRDQPPYPFLGWGARLLPYLEQQPLWSQTQKDYKEQPIPWGPSIPSTPHIGLTTVLPVFVCPADGRSHGPVEPEAFDVAFTHYLGVIGKHNGTWDGVLYLNSRVSLRDVADGTSHTLMVGERPPSPDSRFGWWYAGVGQDFDGDVDVVLSVQPYRTTFRAPTCPYGPYHFSPGSDSDLCDTFHFWSRHIGGGHFLFVDGSTRFLSYSVHPVLPALATRAGGEAVEVP
jgi:prepilin-type processing-associated H-X9-DG protein